MLFWLRTKAFRDTLYDETTRSMTVRRPGERWRPAAWSGSFELQDFTIQLDLSLGDLGRWQAALSPYSLKAVAATDGKESPAMRIMLAAEEVGDLRFFHIAESAGDELINLPPMPEDRTTIRDVAVVVNHVAKYMLFRNLYNQRLDADDPFTKSFSVLANTHDGLTSYLLGELIEIQDEMQRCITILCRD
jgi:hypothetical protein